MSRMKVVFAATYLMIFGALLVGCQRTTTYEVVFDHNYEDAPEAITIEVEEGETVSSQSVSREGHQFQGWYTSDDFEESFDFDTPIESDMTLYAKWETAEDMLKITYEYNYEGSPDALVEYIDEGDGAPELDVSREGYTFFGWFTDEDGENHYTFDDEPDEDLTLYAYWVEAQNYYLGTSANGYQTPRDGEYVFSPVLGKPGFYELEIDFTEDNRDPTYDGHFYKVSTGGWGEEECYGVDHYAFQPAPEQTMEDGTTVGLGSIYIAENTTLTILFDENTETIYDDYEHVFEIPRIYGDFNEDMDRGENWSFKDDEALTLTDDTGDGLYTGLYKIPAYDGDGDGFNMAVAISVSYDMDWHAFGVRDQYRFDGEEAGMGETSVLAPDEETIYEFTYDSETNKTTYEKLESGEIRTFENPRIYGSFNDWQFEGDSVIELKDPYGAGVYEGSDLLPKYEDDNEGHALLVALSVKLYDDEWGIRWGVEEQYLFDGTPAGMGESSYLAPEEETFYTFLFDSNDKTTEVLTPEHGDERAIQGPSVYGDFNDWDYFGDESVFLYDENDDGVYHGTLELPAYEGDDDGHSVVVAITHEYFDDEWGQRWAVGTQYKLDGTEAAMGAVSHLAPEEDTFYHLSYNSETNETEVLTMSDGDVLDFATPRLYGCFNDWQLSGPEAMALEETEEEDIYEGVFYFDAYEGDEDGYMAAIVLSQKFYDDEWGRRFGAEEQYDFDGNDAGMGGTDYFAPDESGYYRFTFDANTNETEIEAIE